VEIVDQDPLFQIPQKYARIIEGKREEASSRGSTMEEREMLKNTLETLKKPLGKKAPFIWKAKYGRWGHFPLFWVYLGPKAGPSGPKPSIQENSP
jgi:hypothetical protein